MSLKTVFEDFTTYLSLGMAGLGYLLGTKKRKADTSKTTEEAIGERIKNITELTGVENKEWQKMTDENKLLKIELQKAYAIVERMSAELETMKKNLKQAMMKIDEQQVELNLHKTLQT